MRREQGFTMVELLMAMAVFSFMMMIVSAGFIQVVRIHQAGIASRTTQQNARLLMDSVSKDIRQSATATAVMGASPQQYRLCLTRGSQTLEYAVDGPGNLQVGAIANPPSGTCPQTLFGVGWRKLNDPRVKVTQFTATTTTPVQPGLGTVMVTLSLASQNNVNSLDTTQTHCLPGPGSQFCAVTTLSSTASLRGGDGL